MSFYFITGNKDKFKEVKLIFPQIKRLDVDLPEIQHIDPREIIKSKIKEAFKHKQAEFVVEDVSLRMDCLDGLPGPFIKWFLKAVGCEGLYKIAKSMGSFDAEAKVVVGYAKSPDSIYYFEGSLRGRIVSPRGDNGFGFDAIFEIEQTGKTLAEYTQEEKSKFSMRAKAFRDLERFLEA